MRYRKTEWEYKNLGTSSCEIVLEKNDTLEELRKLDEEISEEYRVLKTPTCMPEFLLGLAKLGYVHIETQISISMKRGELVPLAVKNEFYNRIEWEELYQAEEVERLAFIKDGTMFTTDRIAIDPHFGVKTAGLRYFNWMRDICERGGRIVLTKIDGRIVNISSMEMRPGGVCYMAVGGSVAAKEEEAFYACMDSSERYAFEKLGAMRLETAVSSNNVPILKIHEKKGYHIKGMHYVYVKHAGRDNH